VKGGFREKGRVQLARPLKALMKREGDALNGSEDCKEQSKAWEKDLFLSRRVGSKLNAEKFERHQEWGLKRGLLFSRKGEY